MIFQGSRRHGGVKTIFADVLGLKHCISWHSCAIFSRYKFTDVVFDAVSRQQPRVKDVLGRLQGRFVIGAIRPNALPPIYITSLHLNHVAEPTRLSGMTTSLLYLVNIFFLEFFGVKIQVPMILRKSWANSEWAAISSCSTSTCPQSFHST